MLTFLSYVALVIFLSSMLVVFGTHPSELNRVTRKVVGYTFTLSLITYVSLMLYIHVP